MVVINYKGDVKIISNIKIDDEELKDIDDMGEEDNLSLNGDIASEENQGNHFCAYQHENQQNFFGANQDDDKDYPNVDADDNKSINNDMERYQAVQNNNNFIPDDHCFSENNLDN